MGNLHGMTNIILIHTWGAASLESTVETDEPTQCTCSPARRRQKASREQTVKRPGKVHQTLQQLLSHSWVGGFLSQSFYTVAMSSLLFIEPQWLASHNLTSEIQMRPLRPSVSQSMQI